MYDTSGDAAHYDKINREPNYYNGSILILRYCTEN